MRSLRTRLLVTATCVLIIFMLLTGAGLEQAFVQSTLQAQRDRMQGLVYALLGAAEPAANGKLKITEATLPDPRLARIQSGLSAIIFNHTGRVVWHSPSLGSPLPKIIAPKVGTSQLGTFKKNFLFTFGVNWVGAHDKAQRYTIAVIENRDDYNAELNAFRRTLWIALGSAAGLLVLIQFFLLRWGLSPLRQLTREVHEIDIGKRSRIDRRYPKELMPLADNLNAMIHSERIQLAHYRNSLGDLAHSLKTPLAILGGIIENHHTPEPVRKQLELPFSRIQEIADYQLRRASAASRRVLSEPVALWPLADKTLTALGKVYADKHLEFINDIDPQLRLRADQGNLYEILGNLLDNACKWARHKVSLSARRSDEICIAIEDDGEGFSGAQDELLQRGVRADSSTPGQGIGLATVADIIELNEGRIELGQSESLGGACVRVYWPA